MSVISGDLFGSTLFGIGFTGCAMTSAAPAQGSSPHAHGRRREVVVNGKRVKTVDVHAHCAVPAAMALIDHRLEAPGLLMTDIDTRIAAMDTQGIDVEALSINPFWYRAERDAAARLIEIQNETLAEPRRPPQTPPPVAGSNSSTGSQQDGGCLHAA